MLHQQGVAPEGAAAQVTDEEVGGGAPLAPANGGQAQLYEKDPAVGEVMLQLPIEMKSEISSRNQS
jgi:hypothetical protein